MGAGFAVLAASAFSGTQATAGWKVTTLGGGRQAWLAGLAALPGGHTAVLLDERRGSEHRLVLYRPGRSPRTLMTTTHTFGASLGADARGNLAVAWYTIPRGASHRRAYVWAGTKIVALTDGTRHAADALAVAPDGNIAVAVSESSPGGRPGRVSVRRSTFGGPLQPVEVSDLQYLYPNALALGPSGAVALGGELWGAPSAPSFTQAVSVSRSFSAAFRPAAALAAATVPPPNVPVTQGTAVGFGPGNTAIAATNTLSCPVGTGGSSRCASGIAGSILQVWLWPVSDAAPGAPIVPSSARFTYLPVVVTSGSTTWIAWYEGATTRLDTLAVAKVTPRRLGAVRRLKLAAPERPDPQELPIAAPAPGGALRFYLPANTKQWSALRTVVMSPTGRFGTTSTVVRGALYAGPNTRGSATPATGLVRNLVGWTSWDDKHGGRARTAHP